MLQNRGPQASRRDRQGYSSFGLHDRAGADRRLYRHGHGRRAGRAVADAGDRHADAQPARRYRGRDLGLAQSVRGQRHQAVRARRLQVLGRDRAQDRDAPSPKGRAGGRARRSSAAPSASTTPAAAISSSSSRAFRAGCGSTGCASSSIARTALPTRSRRPCFGSSAPRCSRSASRPTASTSTASAAR